MSPDGRSHAGEPVRSKQEPVTELGDDAAHPLAERCASEGGPIASVRPSQPIAAATGLCERVRISGSVGGRAADPPLLRVDSFYPRRSGIESNHRVCPAAGVNTIAWTLKLP